MGRQHLDAGQAVGNAPARTRFIPESRRTRAPTSGRPSVGHGVQGWLSAAGRTGCCRCVRTRRGPVGDYRRCARNDAPDRIDFRMTERAEYSAATIQANSPLPQSVEAAYLRLCEVEQQMDLLRHTVDGWSAWPVLRRCGAASPFAARPRTDGG